MLSTKKTHRSVGRAPLGALAKYSSYLWPILVVLPCGAAQRFTPEHVAKLRAVRSVDVSPDGRYVAYLLSVPRIPFKDENGPAWSQLYIVGADGQSRPYITGPVNIGSIRWMPDGKGISFLAKRGKDKHRSLYVIPLHGGEARKVLSHETDIRSYDWCPEGKHVAFLAREKEPNEKDRKRLRKKGFDQEIYEEQLRYVRVWIGSADDEEAESNMLDLPGSASEIHWSPAGGQLAVALAPTPLIDDHYMRRKIYVVDVETGRVAAQVATEGKLGPVRWSPDGRHLAFVGAQDLHDPAAGRLMVVPAAGGVPRELLPDLEGHVTAIAWEDNWTIKYLADVGTWTTFGEVNIDSSERKTHIPVGKAVLSGLSLSRDGRTAAFRGQSDRHPNEVFLMRHGDVSPSRLTDSNPWLADMRFAKQEVVTYKARDGLRLEGILIHPLDEKSGQRYPLILHVHGGPESHNHNGWQTAYSRPGQVAAAQGYAVFYPNYRGSTGRGVKFSKLDHGDPAGKEFDDLVDAVDHLINIGLVDRKRVGVTGGSYGGFATAWCSTYYSDRFGAGVMFVGLSDLVSKGGTTDIPNEMTLVHWRKRLWEDWDLFLKRSPIYYVRKAHTPLLILGGKADTRVHPGQSLELYRYLKVLGQVPVRLVRYPGEGHGNRKAGGRYDYNLRMMRWMNHYLKGPGGSPPPYPLAYKLDTEQGHDKGHDQDDD